MAKEYIEKIDDPRIAVYRDLPHSNFTRQSGIFIAEGLLLAQRLWASSYETVSVLLDERFVDSTSIPVPESVPIYVVPSSLINDVVGFKFHRGVLACGRRRASPKLADILSRPRDQLLAVVCGDIHDPENLGGILRNSAAFGVDLVLLSRSCADPFSRRVLRTSMGTVLKLNIVTELDLFQAFDELRNAGIPLAATVLDERAIPLKQFQPPPKLAVVFGNEGHGLPTTLVDLCDHRLTIPMRLGTDSLNVATASALFLYEITARDSSPS